MDEGVVYNRISQKEPMVLFKPVSWMNNIAFIHQLLLVEPLFISVLAEQGGGKTSFTHVLQQHIDSTITVCLTQASSLFERSDLLLQLGALLNIPDAHSIIDYAAACEARRTVILLVIDDAHHLQPTLIAELLAAVQQQKSPGYFHVCLVSNFSIVPVLQTVSQAVFHPEMIHSIELGLFSEQETKAYVIERLAENLGEEINISDEDLHQFYQLTEGNLVGIRTQMSGFFKKATVKAIRKKLAVRGLAAVTASVFLAVGAGLYTFQYTASDASKGMTSDAAPLLVKAQEANQVPRVLGSEITKIHVAAVRQRVEPVVLQHPVVANTDKTNLYAVVGDSIVVPVNTKSVRTAVHPVLINPVVGHSMITPVNTKSVRMATHQEKITQAPMTAVANSKPKIAISPPSHPLFTIQLMAGSRLISLTRFVEQHHLQGKTQIYRHQIGSVTWYVLTTGHYEARNEANQVAANLPPVLAQLKPWIRATTGLQKV